MTLRIYRESILLCRDCAPLVERIARHDRNLADQLRRAVTSIPLNLSESDGQRGGNRIQRGLTALGLARETNACLEIRRGHRYIEALSTEIVNRINYIIGVLVNVTR